MRIGFVLTLAAGLLAAACAGPSTVSRGTPEEAKAMVAKAIAQFDAQGAAAFPAMSAPNRSFRDRDLYIFVIGPDRTNVAHAVDPAQIGNDVTGLVDAAGNPFGNRLFEAATAEGAWVDYVWEDPLTGKPAPKSSWVVRHDGYVFGCGIYKPT